MKKLGMIIIVILAVLVGLLLARNVLAKMIISTGVKATTGLGLEMDEFSIGLAKPVIHIQGLALLNPKGFTEKVMVQIPEIFVHYDRGALLKGKIHLPEVRIHVEEVNVIRSQEGKLNLDTLKPVKDQKAKKEESKQPSEAPELQIDSLKIKIGTASFRDHSLKDGGVGQTFNLRLDEHYQNVTNPNALIMSVLFKILSRTTIGKLADVDMGQLSDAASEAIDTVSANAKQAASSAAKQASEAMAKAKETQVSEMKESTQGALEDAGGKLKDAAGELKGLFSS